jgi:large subunit ribosomal protein L25
MKLNAQERTKTTKGEVSALRRSGKIPAVLYRRGSTNTLLHVQGDAFQAVLRGIKPGQLATQIFELEVGDARISAILKEVQYHPTTYNILHLDFQELRKDFPISVNVPVVCVGVADCVGIKLGGFLRQVLRSVRVRCPSNAIPKLFTLDITSLGIRQAKRLSDIDLPEGVEPLIAKNEVLAVIAKR